MEQPVELKIEPLDKKRLADFASLIKGYFTEFGIDPEFYRHDQDVTAPFNVYIPPRGNVWLIKSDSDDKVLGLAAVRPLANRTCEVKRFYVLPEFRNQGVGQALLNEVFDFCKKQEYVEILLTLSPEQKPALALCEKNGFTYCARYNDDNRSGLFLSYRFEE